ncbi:MAG: PQQ-binding-like beta-propeller repeat protein [Calditrichia bacterium]
MDRDTSPECAKRDVLRRRQGRGILSLHLLILASAVFSLQLNAQEANPLSLRNQVSSSADVFAEPRLPYVDKPAISPIWQNTYNAFLAPATDAAVDIGVDRFGNSIVTGWSDSLTSSCDFLTIKYDPDGQIIWSRRYNSGFGIADYPVALAIDINGEITVTGYRELEPGNNEVVTLRYSENGELLWLQHFTHNGASRPVAILAEDGDGVFISISIDTPDGNTDAMIVHYKENGTLAWENSYQNSAFRQDAFSELYRATDGAIYAVGHTNSGGYTKTLLHKIDLQGNTLWSRSYDDGNGADEYAISIAGNTKGVVLAGSSIRNDSGDFFFIAVDSFGNQRWKEVVDSDDSADNRLVDLAGVEDGLVATGYSSAGTNSSIWTVKLNTNGSVQWQQQFQYSGRSYPTDLIVDLNMNILLTGFSELGSNHSQMLVVKYSQSGTELWRDAIGADNPFHHDGRAIAVGADGTLCATGFGYSREDGWDMVTAAYSASGEKRWQQNYTAPSTSREIAISSVQDEQSRLYTVGHSFTGECGWDIVLLCEAPTGEKLWNAILDEHGEDDLAVAMQRFENHIYIMGSSQSASGSAEVVVYKYSLSGELLWKRFYSGASDRNPIALAISDSGELFIAAQDLQNAAPTATLLAIASNGNLLWEYHAAENMTDAMAVPTAMAVRGNKLALVGSSLIGITDQDFVTSLFHMDGQLLWQRSYGGNSGYIDSAVDVLLESDENVIVCGTSYENGYNSDISVISYSASGDVLWQDQLNGSGNNNDLAYALREAPQGGIYLLGRAFTVLEKDDLVLRHYQHDGTATFTTYLSTAAAYNDSYYQWDVSNNAILVAAATARAGAALLLVDLQGNELWQHNMPGRERLSQSVQTLQLENDGTFYVTATLNVSGWSGIETARYNPSTVGIADDDSKVGFTLEDNYPNPFNPETQIAFTLPQAKKVRLEILNVLGEVVAVLSDGYRREGRHVVEWHAGNFASGVYFYRLNYADFSDTKQMLLLR